MTTKVNAPVLSYAKPAPSRSGTRSLIFASIAIGLYGVLVAATPLLGKPTGESALKGFVVTGIVALVLCAACAILFGTVGLWQGRSRDGRCIAGIATAVVAVLLLAATT